RISVGKGPHHIAFSRDGRRAYVANNDSGVVTVVDVASRGMAGRIPAGRGLHGVAVREWEWPR
ncbi:MAG: beta-propeller fold lactonase family protein, partial [candidate division NC10 bacterium]|nr:beta-propeller fold lactonase family protein [candidate division NC10 bacterium]